MTQDHLLSVGTMHKTPKNNLHLGDWKAVCDVCGRYFHASELRKRWDGFRVCTEDWEQRQPQDLLRSRPDKQNPPWTRPEQPDRFTTHTYLEKYYTMPGYVAEGYDNQP